MRTGRGGLVGTFVACVAVLTACGGESDPTVARGEELYQNNCVLCHGNEGQGTPGGPPVVHELYVPENTSDEAFRVSIQEGTPERAWQYGDMPSIALNDDEIEAVTAYVRDLQRDEGLID